MLYKSIYVNETVLICIKVAKEPKNGLTCQRRILCSKSVKKDGFLNNMFKKEQPPQNTWL